MAAVDITARGMAASGAAAAQRANDRLDVLPNGMNYIGSVTYFKDLPNDASIGDVYTVKYAGESGSTPDGREYVWGTYENTDQWIAVGPDMSQYQPLLVSAENIKTINGVTLLGSGDMYIGTNRAFPSAWPTTSATTTKAFCDVVNADSQAVQGTSYLGEVRWSDLPDNLVNAEVIVEIMAGTGTSNKVIHLILSSGNRAPYRWEYTYWSNGSSISGWIGFQPALTAGTNISISGNTISATVAGIQECPTTTDGEYVVHATVLNGNVTYTWLPDTGVYTTET